MPQTIPHSERIPNLARMSAFEAAAFAPCFAVWILVVLLMLPVTILAVPAHHVLRNQADAQCGFVLALVLFGALNAVFVPVLLVYALWN
jgi:hypothetical protein